MSTLRASRVDGWIFILTAVLLSISILMVFSTTAISSQESFGTPAALLKKHLVQVVMGVVFLFMTTKLHPRTLYKLSTALLVIGIIGLMLVLIPGIGHVAGGARRWFAIGPMRFQPAELVKFAMVLYMSSYIGRHSNEMLRFVPGVAVPLGIVAFTAALLLLQPDFGSTVIILAVVFIQLLTVSRVSHLIGLGVAAAMCLAVLVVSSPYRFKRFESFLDPFQNQSASGYQLVQSLIAVGSGGLTGEGLGAGKQKLYYLPAAHTDFIFAVIAEELGLVGAVGVLGLFLAFAVCGFSVARRFVNDPFLCSLSLGITSLIVVPALLNMGVVLGLLPTKGLVLPLVAYGGTAMVVNLAMVGVLIRLARLRPEEYER